MNEENVINPLHIGKKIWVLFPTLVEGGCESLAFPCVLFWEQQFEKKMTEMNYMIRSPPI